MWEEKIDFLLYLYTHAIKNTMYRACNEKTNNLISAQYITQSIESTTDTHTHSQPIYVRGAGIVHNGVQENPSLTMVDVPEKTVFAYKTTQNNYETFFKTFKTMLRTIFLLFVVVLLAISAVAKVVPASGVAVPISSCTPKKGTTKAACLTLAKQW